MYGVRYKSSQNSRNTEENFCHLGFCNRFLDMTPKTWATGDGTYKPHFIKIQNVLCKGYYRECEKHNRMGEIFVNYTSDKECI